MDQPCLVAAGVPPDGGADLAIEVVMTDELSAEAMQELRRLFFSAFDDGFDELDWAHGLGGHHVVVRDRTTGVIVGHASVVPREVLVGGKQIHTGYVEAVSTLPTRQRQGIGRLVMAEVARVLQGHFEMGALATGVVDFYRRLGWEEWTGPISAYDEEGVHPTPEEEGAVLVLRFGSSTDIELSLPISAPARPGDDW
ncbi:MAG TPA: GNAT family N-acetyltransferase [Acidimicrobiales bacterium]|nr:GNAT family N-acetyltransferase [Acidimicrobiales bacterium]